MSQYGPTTSQSIRDRIAAFYSHYCPEKPASHVDYLLEKYAGHEEEVIEILKEKYGPEPMANIPRSEVDRVTALLRSPVATEALTRQFAGQEAALRHALVDRLGPEPHITGRSTQPKLTTLRPEVDRAVSALSMYAADSFYNADPVAQAGALLDAELNRRRDQFEVDMRLLEQQESRREELQVLQAITETKLELQRQDVEMQQLRLALSAAKTEAANKAEAHDEAIRHVAQQLTRAKLKLLSLKSVVDPHIVSARRLEAVVAKTVETEEELSHSVQYCRCLAEVVRRHFKLYPLSPLHVSLRMLDAAMCSRLEA